MVDLIKINLPEGLPPAYQKTLTENLKLVEQLFFRQDATPYNASERSLKVLHFVDMFVEVFNHSAKQLASPATRRRINTAVVLKDETPVVRECITKYREIFRRHFRGVHYVSLAKLREISDSTQGETLELFRSLTAQLGLQIIEEGRLRWFLSLERYWIDNINGDRRNEDLWGIKAEAVEKFKSKVVDMFPYLYSKEHSTGDAALMYCEENQFTWELKGLLNGIKNGFKGQIPFRDQEDPKIVTSLCSELEAHLEKNIIKDLKIQNSDMQTKAQAFLSGIIDKCVEEYTAAMMGICLNQRKSQLDVAAIHRDHSKLVDEYRPKFEMRQNEEEIEVGWKEQRIRCRYGKLGFMERTWTAYGSRTYEAFQKIVKDASKKAQHQLDTCEKKSREETKKYVEAISDLWSNFGLESFATGLESNVMEAGLQSMFSHLREANKASSNALVEASVPVNMAEPQVMQNYKEAYMEWFVWLFRHSKLKDMPESNLEKCELLRKVIPECHHGAKNHVSGILHWECLRSIDSRLEPAFLEDLDRFAGNFVAQLNENAKSFLEDIFRKYEHVPFKPVTGTDTMMKNGTAIGINTQHQYMTEMPEYCDKSFEELQLEYRQHCRATSTTIMKGVEDPLPSAQLAFDFERNLRLPAVSVEPPNMARHVEEGVSSPPPQSQMGSACVAPRRRNVRRRHR